MKKYNIHQSIFNHTRYLILLHYFFFQILYSTRNKLNGSIEIFIMTLKDYFNLLVYSVYIKICHIEKLHFRQEIFCCNLPCFHPNVTFDYFFKIF